jgi:hypothetical protein
MIPLQRIPIRGCVPIMEGKGKGKDIRLSRVMLSRIPCSTTFLETFKLCFLSKGLD